MRTAVDTAVLLDVLGGDAEFGAASREALRAAYDAGSLVASEVVWAELRAHFADELAFEKAAGALGLDFTPIGPGAAALAGQLWRKQRASTRKSRAAQPARGPGPAESRRVLADLLIGAHALKQADALLTRDRAFYRACFKGLRVLEP